MYFLSLGRTDFLLLYFVVELIGRVYLFSHEYKGKFEYFLIIELLIYPAFFCAHTNDFKSLLIRDSPLSKNIFHDSHNIKMYINMKIAV